MGTNQIGVGGAFYPWTSLGGTTTGDPTVLQLANGAMTMYAVGADHNVYGRSQVGAGGAWNWWQLV